VTKVRILPEILSNKIAAGEVVDRPASVVKELVENAIDAGSNQINIDIDQGGRSLIRVSDDGCGMGHDDALLAIERYATSKLAAESDLFDIKSLGFRGEALPSIAAVSRLSLITREEQADAATEIRVEGGKVTSVLPTGAPKGTMITVRQLFFNTPARRKFMKTVSTEFGHIAEIVSCIALSRPEIRFRLTHNGKTVREWHNVRSPAVRMSDVLGENLEPLFYAVSCNTFAVALSGWVCDPIETRSSPGKIYTFVNGRFIRDRGLQRAVVDGFRGRLMKGRFPLAVLYLSVPLPEVDVNVHPTKHEVRFSRQGEVYGAIRTAVLEALNGKKEHNPGEFQPNLSSQSVIRPAGQTGIQVLPPYENAAPGVSESKSSYGENKTAAVPQQAALFTRETLRSAEVIGQFNNSYILCEKEDELLVIDQHAAHERILYERISGRAGATASLQIQKRLVPETIELGHRESAALELVLSELTRAGLEIEHFGDNTFIVKGVPEILGDKPIQPLVTEIAETVDAYGYRQEIGKAIDESIILMACHGAVKANQPLTGKQMAVIIEQLYECENPYSCPHGRPTMLSWHAGLLEKRFKRTK
jgi:DNA mismatch repair protein MutL